MKKQALFLAAGLAVVSAGISCQSIYARAAFVPFESDDDATLGHALIEHATLKSDTGSTITLGTTTEQGREGLIYDGPIIDSIEFDCSYGDPLEDVTDYSLISRTGSLFGSLTSLKLCNAGGVDWENLAGMESLKTLSIVPAYQIPEDYFLNGGTPVDLAGIEGLTQLESLTITDTPIFNLAHIEDLSGLKSLHLDDDGIVDVSGISKLNNLTDFSFNSNNIQDVLPIAEKAGIQGETVADTYRHLIESSVPLITGNTWYFEAEKNTPYTFADNADFVNHYLFEGDLIREADGITIDKDARTVTLTEDMGSVYFGNIGRYGYYIKLIASDDGGNESDSGDSTVNPDTLDHSMLGWAMGLAAAIIAGASVTFFVKSRR